MGATYEADMWGSLLICGGLAIRLPEFASKPATTDTLAAASRKRINNPPQVNNLPHERGSTVRSPIRLGTKARSSK
jgi:hypothetical protein